MRSFKRLVKKEKNGVFLFVISFFVPEIFKFSNYANFVYLYISLCRTLNETFTAKSNDGLPTTP